MHELAVTESILEITLQHATSAGASKVTAINLVVGELTGFVSESIQFYFDMLARDTIASEALLVIERVPARLRCRACGHLFVLEGHNWICPSCQALGGEVLSGREFRVESIEVE